MSRRLDYLFPEFAEVQENLAEFGLEIEDSDMEEAKNYYPPAPKDDKRFEFQKWQPEGKVYTPKPPCVHKKTPIFKASGLNFYASKKDGFQTLNPPASQTLYIDCVGHLDRNPIKSPKFADDLMDLGLNSISIDWPDYGIPNINPEFFKRVIQIAKKNKLQNIVAFCMGSHGRTGTALALLALASGRVKTAKQAISFIRKEHCDRAIEGDKQEQYIEDYVKFYR